MSKNGKTDTKTLEELVNIMARNVADIKGNMATKDDIKRLEMGLGDVERRLSAKIDAVEEKVDNLEMVDVLNLQGRVSVLEKDVKQLKHKHA